MNLPLVQIAAAFLVAIGACATLIVNARATHEAHSRLFRATCAEWRITVDSARKASLSMQAGLFRERYLHVRDVQVKLFAAIRSFVKAFYFFVALSITASVDQYYVRHGSAAPWWIELLSIGLGLVIAGLFVHGLSLMLTASRGQLKELEDSQATLDVEGKDVLPAQVALPPPDRAVRVPGMFG